ncbi:hypothetical protein Hanom_Chr16g01427241 [Helianthus anomalus]
MGCFGLYIISMGSKWRTQKFFSGGADEGFNHIYKGCDRVFSLKNTQFFFSRGAPAHPAIKVGPPMSNRYV